MAEFNPSDLIETGSNAIPNGQVASVMRRSMENRNLLSEKGALYAGTGEPYATQDSVGNTYNTAITDAVEAPTQSGQVLVSNLDSGGPDTGLEWQSAAPNAINATNATKLTSGTVGSSTTPVYFNNGQPVVCGGNLLVNITGNAATATNVTAGINGKAISSIFERDGVTARNARTATYDGEGNNIANTYVNISSNQTITGQKTFNNLLINNSLEFSGLSNDSLWSSISFSSGNTNELPMGLYLARVKSGASIIAQGGLLFSDGQSGWSVYIPYCGSGTGGYYFKSNSIGFKAYTILYGEENTTISSLSSFTSTFQIIRIL